MRFCRADPPRATEECHSRCRVHRSGGEQAPAERVWRNQPQRKFFKMVKIVDFDIVVLTSILIKINIFIMPLLLFQQNKTNGGTPLLIYRLSPRPVRGLSSCGREAVGLRLVNEYHRCRDDMCGDIIKSDRVGLHCGMGMNDMATLLWVRVRRLAVDERRRAPPPTSTSTHSVSCGSCACAWLYLASLRAAATTPQHAEQLLQCGMRKSMRSCRF
jgi:hypothetical protein